MLTENLGDLRADWEIMAMMKLSERSLSIFLSEEPDLYTLKEGRTINSS